MMRTQPEPTFDPHSLRVLEFGQVLEIAAGFADSEEGLHAVKILAVASDAASARDRLARTSELLNAVRFDDPIPRITLPSLRPLLPKLSVAGSVLEIGDIAAVAHLLEIVRDIRSYFTDRVERYPLAAADTAILEPHDELAKEIRRVITPELTIADNASPELRSIRRSLSRMRDELRDSVERTLAGLPDEVLGERTVTIRDGRLVIPVRDSMKRRVPGAVHDRSQTGRTLFIEPIVAIEANNRVRELELAEEAEIFRILAALSERIVAIAGPIEAALDTLVRLDTVAAGARYGDSVGGVIPEISGDPSIRLINARHPLLDWKFRQRGDGATVVPLTLKLGGDVHTMVITGPNAGGKTVALKTVGLMVLMALSGLPVPADGGTSVYAPSGVYADIGDEQSIADDLSTFSSHMRHIVTVLREAASGTLVLLDELGGGTNPADGEAIALAVLRKLTGVGAVTVATSHHDALKVFAHETPGVMNASMEFDLEHQSPSFRLNVGVPGSSYAFEIAARMGMPEDVLHDAEALAGGEKKSLAGLIGELEDHVREADRIRENADRERKRLESLAGEAERRVSDLKFRRNELMAEAVAESRKFVTDANRTIEATIRELRETRASKEAIAQARETVRETEHALTERAAELAPSPKPGSRQALTNPVPGMRAWVNALGGEAMIEEVLSGGTKVRVGMASGSGGLIVEASSLFVPEGSGRTKPRRVVINAPSTPDMGNEIDLRGKTFEEAQETLDLFLDSMVRSGFETVHIIHGKGTGALRKKITAYLKGHPAVASHRLGDWNEGGAGVTVATMARR